MKAIDTAKLIANAAHDTKAESIVIMDMRGISNVTDYFVICSAPSQRRVKAITDSIEEALEEKGIKHHHIEGKREALWALIDYGDVVAHIFYEETREFYNLERLWQDAPREHISFQCTSPRSKST